MLTISTTATTSLATVQTTCGFQARRPHLPLPPWSATGYSDERRHTSRRRHQPSASAFVIVGSTDCPTNTAACDNRRSCLSCCLQQTLEQFTTRRHLCSTLRVFSARQRICLARYMLSPVRLSVCPSDGCIIEQEAKLSLG